MSVAAYPAVARESGSFGPPSKLGSRQAVFPLPAVDRDGNVLVGWNDEDDADFTGNVLVSYRRHGARRGFSRAKRISHRGKESFLLDLAVAPGGTAFALVEVESDKRIHHDSVFWRRRAPGAGGRWGKLRVLDARSFSTATAGELAVDAAGNAVALIQRDHEVYAAYLPARGRGPSRPLQRLSNAPGGAPGFGAVAIDGRGNAVAVWTERRCSNPWDYVVYAAWRPSGRTSVFGAPEAVSDSKAGAANPDVAISRGGAAVAVWERVSGRQPDRAFPPRGCAGAPQPSRPRDASTSTSIEAAVRPAGAAGGFGRPMRISRGGGSYAWPQVTTAGRRRTQVAWKHFGRRGSVRAALARRSWMFAPPRQISSPFPRNDFLGREPPALVRTGRNREIVGWGTLKRGPRGRETRRAQLAPITPFSKLRGGEPPAIASNANGTTAVAWARSYVQIRIDAP